MQLVAADAPRLPEVGVEVSPELNALVAAMLDKGPRARPTAREFRARLAGIGHRRPRAHR